jgi:hypothetical protein
MSRENGKTVPRFDNALAGVIIAFDPETGDALYVHEKYVETIDGAPAYPAEITDDEREQVRAEAVERYPRRRIDLITARPEDVVTTEPELGGLESTHYRVDPMTRKLRREPEIDVDLLQEQLWMMCGPHLKGR